MLSPGNSVELGAPKCCRIALASFLIFNFNPASIFMGDAGSTFLGLFIVIMFINSFNTVQWISYRISTCMAISVPLFEMIYVIILRTRKGLNPMMGSKDHFPLRLHFMGFTVKQAVLISYFVTVTSCLAAFIVLDKKPAFIIGISLFLLTGFISFGWYLSKVSVDPPSQS